MNLLQGLSDFWLRFFADFPLLQQFFSGSMDLLGAAYLRLLESVLTLSLRDTPVFRKEFFVPLVISEDDLVQRGTKFEVDITTRQLRNFVFLYNKILEPTVVLEKYKDFNIEEEAGTTRLIFTRNIFNWTGNGETIPGVAFTVLNGKRYLSFWIPNAEFDAADLYVHYGYLVDRYAPSSEAYKAFLEGLFFYFAVGGSATAYIKSAFHIAVGLPVARDNELLVSVESTATKNIITTDKNTYEFNLLIPLREDILDRRNWGSLRFRVFESFTEIFKVDDVLTDPTAYYDTVLPPQLAPEQCYDRRHATLQVFENRINNPAGLIQIGDPGFYIGGDDDGYVPETRPALRHNYAYCVLRILKQNIIFVKVNSSVLISGVIPFVDFAENIIATVIPGKPVYVLLENLLPQEFQDALVVQELLGIKANVVKEEQLPQTNPFLPIDGTWYIGDYYEYVSNTPTIRRYNDDPPATYPNTAGKVPLYIGMESVTIPATTRLKDMALEIKLQ